MTSDRRIVEYAEPAGPVPTGVVQAAANPERERRPVSNRLRRLRAGVAIGKRRLEHSREWRVVAGTKPERIRTALPVRQPLNRGDVPLIVNSKQVLDIPGPRVDWLNPIPPQQLDRPPKPLRLQRMLRAEIVFQDLRGVEKVWKAHLASVRALSVEAFKGY